MRSIRRRLLAVVVATGVVALAVPFSGASAQVPTVAGGAFPPIIVGIGGNQIGLAGCVNTNRPSVGGNNGSTSAQSCGGLTFQGAQVGSMNSAIGPPTLVASPFTEVNTSAGAITQLG